MADPEKQPEQQKAVPSKHVIATKVSGTVKWFNVKSGYGFINRNDTKEDVFVHQSAIVKNNPKKAVRSVGDGEVVEFDVVVGEKGNEAANVTGPEGEPVKGSPYAADKRRGYRQWFYPRRRMRPRPREGEEGAEYESGGENKGEEGAEPREGGQGANPRRFRPRRRFDPNYYNRPRRGPGSRDGQPGEGYDEAQGEDKEGDDGGGDGARPGGGRGRGGPGRRYFRRNFRGGPGESKEQQGGAANGTGGRGGGRVRYRRPRQGKGSARNSQSEGEKQKPEQQSAEKAPDSAPSKQEPSGQAVQNTTTTESSA
ncbi:hypothetical protein B566_EDAN010771 [Ephemera danica]|nr:hypothetical protein B566_EDAN010771 [Ephemera danica]